MKTNLALLLVVLLAGSLPAAEILPGWGTNLVMAQRLARVADKPVLLYFTATWCGPCKLMAKTTLNQPAVMADLDALSRVLLDIDAQPALASAQSVSAVPTFVLLDSDGDELQRTSGYQDTNRFRAWLAAGRRAFAGASERRKKLNEEKQAIVASLKSPTGPSQESMRQLFDVAARRETAAQEFAVAQLKQVAGRNPSLLLTGLSHTNLAARIRIANALREVLGESFVFDPWESAEVRARQVAEVHLAPRRLKLEDGGDAR